MNILDTLPKKSIKLANSLTFFKFFYSIIAFSVFITIPISLLALFDNYYFDFEYKTEFLKKIKKIDTLKIPENFWLTYPEFVSREKEENWWSIHKRVFDLLEKNRIVQIVFEIGDNLEISKPYLIKKPTIQSLSSKILIGYLVCLCFIISSILVIIRHKELYGVLLGIFLMSCALYNITSIPMAYRFITLKPLYFRLLVYLNYLAGGALITFVHFTLIFPRPKLIIEKYPNAIWSLYIYFFLVTFLYYSGITAFDFSLPFFFLWILVLIYSFWDSIINEKDRFLRLQNTIILLAPIFVSIIFVILHIVPLALGTTYIDFAYFALISLILAFALPIAIDNIKIYRLTLRLKSDLQKGKEELRREVHDCVLRKFSIISITCQNILTFIKKAEYEKALKLISTILRESRLSSNDLRFFMEIVQAEKLLLKDYINKVRYYANKILEPHDITLKVAYSLQWVKEEIMNDTQTLKIQIRLFWIIGEALTNIIIHSKARNVLLFFSFFEDSILLKIEDDGMGFDLSKCPSDHMGLLNIQKHVSAINGKMDIKTSAKKGTTIKIIVPV